ncbi:MAG: hypothetical protein L0Y55_19860, partial [Anaerolineales bacterium]|nr:hypothetical protein [Anaerolineales bacterium]
MPDSSSTNNARLVRHSHAPHFAELFLVNAVGAIIVIRVFLTLTGFPQLGGHGLHIAHTLWGGLFMLSALLLSLFFLNRQVNYVAAVIGGLGFGAFIDELGKFITSDNDYFFRPTFALVYVIFLILFFAIRFVLMRQPLSNREHFANALDLLASGSARGLAQADRAEFTAHLARADVSENLRSELGELADAFESAQIEKPGAYTRVKDRAAQIFTSVVMMRWAKAIIVAIFTARALAQVWFGLSQVWLSDDPKPLPETFAGLDFFGWGFIVCVLIEWLLVGRGIVALLHRRHIVLSWFKRAVVVNI